MMNQNTGFDTVFEIAIRLHQYGPVRTHGQSKMDCSHSCFLCDRNRNYLGCTSLISDLKGLFECAFVIGIHDELDFSVKVRSFEQPEMGSRVRHMLDAYINPHDAISSGYTSPLMGIPRLIGL